MVGIEVTTHTGRDVLQSAAVFKNERMVVWEYVSNSIDYVDPGTSPRVEVTIEPRKRRITIIDNGRGMDADGLRNFFVMHGENQDRKAGRAGRGRFGTGKSAAFGIADLLRITTVRNGRRSKVELHKRELESVASGQAIPVRVLEHEVTDRRPNGTLIEVEEVTLRSMDQQGVIEYIEQHLAHLPKDVSVFVNGHECEFTEPPVDREFVYMASPQEQEILGDVSLVLKVSKQPLSEQLRGVSIFADGVWHETTLLASRGKEMSEYIFGEFDVPRLGTDSGVPSAFDLSRSMSLNPANPLVAAIHAFLAPKIEEVRKQLVEAGREAKATEQARRLKEEASRIEEIINADFQAFRRRVQEVRAASLRSGIDAADGNDEARPGAGPVEDDFIFGGDEPAAPIAPTGESGREGGEGKPKSDNPRRMNPVVTPSDDGADGGRSEPRSQVRDHARGGFQIDFEHQGAEAARAIYVKDRRTIYINLDHPQIAAAMGVSGIEDPVFRRLVNEVAFGEYSIALAVELDAREEFIEPIDAITEIRNSVNRLARAAAALYA